MIYFTSDTHFGHENIIKYCNRPFKNSNQMNNVLIRNYNEIVTNDDVVYFLGDMMMSNDKHYLERLIQKMKGRKILISGNHDRLKPFDYVEIGFESVHTSLTIEYYEVDFRLIHDPAAFCDRKEDCIYLYGHLHTTQIDIPNSHCCCVEQNEYKPISIDDIFDKIEERMKV